MKNVFVFDIEVAPNFFYVLFINYRKNESYGFEISARKDESFLLAEFLSNDLLLMGYNNIEYDNPILSAAASGAGCYELYELSCDLIGADDGLHKWELIKKYPIVPKTVDLLKMLFSKKLRVSLKSLMITLQWHKVQDLPFSPHENIPVENFDEVISYCYNDVEFTKHLAKTVAESLNLRVEIEKSYGIDVMSRDGVSTGLAVLLRMYSGLTGSSEKSIKDRSPKDYSELRLEECIVDTVSFKSKEFQDLLEFYKSKSDTSVSNKVKFHDKLYSYGVGGLHTEDAPGVLTTDDDELFIDADVTSFYPRIVIEYDLHPAHLGSAFVEVYRKIYDERIVAKKAGDKLKSETFKLALNGTFGNLRNQYAWVRDEKVFFTITVSGQLLLTMLCERLVLNGFEVISANTDGVTARVKKNNLEKYYEVCNQWQRDTLMQLEYAYYNKIIRRDVNCYYAFVCNENGQFAGSVKEKGDWTRSLVLGKGYDKPIIKIALYEYFANSVAPEDTIRNHKNIYNFCMSQKVGSQFYVLLGEHKLPQRINRYYASNKGDYMFKVKKTTLEKTSICAQQPVRLFNNFVELSDYDIDYQYYISEVYKIIEVVKPSQLKLF